VHRRDVPTVGEKTRLYPHGYGFCQCGCGQRTKPSRNGVYPVYASKNSSDEENHKATNNPTLVKLTEMQSHQETTLMGIRTIANEVESVTKFLQDFWTYKDKDKQIAVDKLTRILAGLKKLHGRQGEIEER